MGTQVEAVSEHLELVESPLLIHLLGQCLLNTWVPGAVLPRLGSFKNSGPSPAFLTPGTSFMEDNFSMNEGSRVRRMI